MGRINADPDAGGRAESATAGFATAASSLASPARASASWRVSVEMVPAIRPAVCACVDAITRAISVLNELGDGNGVAEVR